MLAAAWTLHLASLIVLRHVARQVPSLPPPRTLSMDEVWAVVLATVFVTGTPAVAATLASLVAMLLGHDLIALLTALVIFPSASLNLYLAYLIRREVRVSRIAYAVRNL